jgi:transcriptional regulator with XRE-family HTH domain
MNVETQIKGIQIQIGAEIKNWRVTRGVSFLELARRAGISKGNLSKIERGVGNPSIETLVKITHALRISLFTDLVEDPKS